MLSGRLPARVLDRQTLQRALGAAPRASVDAAAAAPEGSRSWTSEQYVRQPCAYGATLQSGGLDQPTPGGSDPGAS
jgi:hypothetical protein